MKRLSLWLALAGTCWVMTLSFGARADTPEPATEPPPEAGDGDYTLESADTLSDDQLEVSVGASGGVGARLRRSQRVSFRGGGTRGTLRDGDDPLAGGAVQAALAGGTLAAGRMAPRWGRGLVLGGAAEPWARSAQDRGAHATYRGRAGDGLAFETPYAAVFAGRFRKQALRGVHVAHGALGLGLLTTRGQKQVSTAWDGEAHALEFALDADARWRAEAALTGDAGDTRLALRVRGGLGAFRALAEPARTGPARALAASALREWAWGSTSVFGALWQWRPGQQGARGAIEAAAVLGPQASFACGLEQQRGPRREPLPNAGTTGGRQGLWCEWRGGTTPARLTLRHELWGERAFARAAVRRVLLARAELASAYGSRVHVTHAVWQVRRGESLYLPEPAADRLVLRASSGSGTRTRVELRMPLAVGDIRVGLTLATGGTRAGATPPAWTVEWSRKSRLASEQMRSP